MDGESRPDENPFKEPRLSQNLDLLKNPSQEPRLQRKNATKVLIYL